MADPPCAFALCQVDRDLRARSGPQLAIRHPVFNFLPGYHTQSIRPLKLARFLPVEIYRDRVEAGRMLGEALRGLDWVDKAGSDLLVLAIPRGGVVVGAEVARILGASLDVWLARKLGAPHNPELAIGSVASHGELILDQSLIETLGVSAPFIQEAVRRERAELERRLETYRGNAEPVRVKDRTVVLVDDGVATGSTALAALAALRQGGAAARILAVPVAPQDRMSVLRRSAEAVVVLQEAAVFYAVGQFYENFEVVEDVDVIRLLSGFSR